MSKINLVAFKHVTSGGGGGGGGDSGGSGSGRGSGGGGGGRDGDGRGKGLGGRDGKEVIQYLIVDFLLEPHFFFEICFPHVEQ